MNPSKGLRILDYDENNETIFTLDDIMLEISNGNQFYWSIQFIKGIGDLQLPISNPEFSKLVLDLERGYLIRWTELLSLLKKFSHIDWLTLIGCKEEKNLKRYKSDQEMYESCDIVIVMFDNSYWEIFTKDEELYYRLKKKFKIEKYLETDFQNEKK